MRTIRGNSHKKKILEKIKQSDDFLKKIDKHVKLTNETGKEYGFIICENKKFMPEYDCIGDKCSVAIPVYERCNMGSIVGDHHTHPERIRSNASLVDLVHIITAIFHRYLPDKSILCVTGTKSTETNCYTPKNALSYWQAKKAYQQYKEGKNELDPETNWLFDLFDRIAFNYKPK